MDKNKAVIKEYRVKKHVFQSKRKKKSKNERTINFLENPYTSFNMQP